MELERPFEIRPPETSRYNRGANAETNPIPRRSVRHQASQESSLKINLRTSNKPSGS